MSLLGWGYRHLKFGPFAQVFEQPGYLELLNLVDEKQCQVVLAQIQTGILGSRRAKKFIGRFLAGTNWRPHLVGAVAILLLHETNGDDQELVDWLWCAVDEGSWVAPQLIATLVLIDPEFVQEAKRRIDQRCPVSIPTILSPARRHSATGPAGVAARASKNMASLLQMLGNFSSEAQWVAAQRSNGEIIRMLESDCDTSGDIADQWLIAVQHQLAEFGIEPSLLATQ